MEQGEKRLPKRVGKYVHAIGRRKRATARIYLAEGSGALHSVNVRRSPAETGSLDFAGRPFRRSAPSRSILWIALRLAPG